MCSNRKRIPEHKATRPNGFLCSHATINATMDAKNIFLDPDEQTYNAEKVSRDGKIAVGFRDATKKGRGERVEEKLKKYA